MAKGDIMPWVSPLGGTYEVRWNQMTNGEVFEMGEPVCVVNAGTLTEPPDDATQIIIGDFDEGGEGGIACFGPGDGNINPKTGIAFATLDDIAYWPFGQGNLFITDNCFAAGAATAITPAQTDVGEPYQMVYSTTTGIVGWGLERTAALSGVDLVSIVVEVLDARKVPIRISGQDGVYFVFETLRPSLAAA